MNQKKWLDELEDRGAVISVVGLGYVGLPTAINFHNAGFRVIGIDSSKEVVESLNDGKVHLADTSFDRSIPMDKKWKVTDNYEKAIPFSDVVLITVPTPVNDDNSPNLDYVRSAVSSVLDNIRSESSTIIVLESTVYPGVTRDVFRECCEERQISIGKDVFPAYCPERVDPGPNGREVNSVAQIVGCDFPKIGDFLASMFSRITSEKSIYVGNIEVAEAAKLIENVQRDIDIAFANELAMVLPKIGVDVEDVLDAASTKWNFHRHSPGVGVGGHCIPVDPYYYIDIARNLGLPSLLANASRKINSGMPEYTARQIKEIFKGNLSNKRCLILGYSYKPGLGDTRETPVKDLVMELRKYNCEVLIWDPLVDRNEFPDETLAVSNPYEVEEIDIVILATAHQEILETDWAKLSGNCNTPVIYDGRRVLDKFVFIESGWSYYGVGMPS